MIPQLYDIEQAKNEVRPDGRNGKQLLSTMMNFNQIINSKKYSYPKFNGKSYEELLLTSKCKFGL